MKRIRNKKKMIGGMSRMSIAVNDRSKLEHLVATLNQYLLDLDMGPTDGPEIIIYERMESIIDDLESYLSNNEIDPYEIEHWGGNASWGSCSD
jgi:hypothetical protein